VIAGVVHRTLVVPEADVVEPAMARAAAR